MIIESAVLDQEQLDALRTLQQPGEPDVLALVFDEFRQESRQQMRLLRQALSTSDARALNHTAHSLKSSGAALGATQLAALCAEIEADCKDDAMPAHIAQLVARTEAEYALVLVALERAEQG